MYRGIKCGGLILLCRLIIATSQISDQLHEKYIGCFVDNQRDSKLEHVLTNWKDLTIEICIQKCFIEANQTISEVTYMYAALNNGRRCICRNNPGLQLRDQDCNVKCSGARQQLCGGNATNRFYSLYSVCSVGSFGTNCDQSCHCKRHLPCDRKTGICPDGCDSQWTRASCSISIRPSTNDILRCSVDKDCNMNESCNVIDLEYMNVSRCRCKQGYHRMNAWDDCTDESECQLESPSSPCNADSERCILSFGNYTCKCKENFVDMFGKCVEFNSTTVVRIIVGTLLAISLLVNAILIVSRRKRAKSGKSEPGKDMAFESSFGIISDQYELNRREISSDVEPNSTYEEISSGQPKPSVGPKPRF